MLAIINAELVMKNHFIPEAVLFVEDGDEEEYTIVGARESDPINNKISNECPMGTALLGHIVGETVSVDAPDGTYQLKILGIRR